MDLESEPKSSFSDIALNLGSILLAVSSASFAVLVILQGPQSIVSNNSSQVNIEIDQSIITGSIENVSKTPFRPNNSKRGSKFGTDYSSYTVRSIDNGVATIDFFGETSVRTVKARAGSYIDGIGLVKSFVQKNGTWFVLTSTN